MRTTIAAIASLFVTLQQVNVATARCYMCVECPGAHNVICPIDPELCIYPQCPEDPSLPGPPKGPEPPEGPEGPGPDPTTIPVCDIDTLTCPDGTVLKREPMLDCNFFPCPMTRKLRGTENFTPKFVANNNNDTN